MLSRILDMDNGFFRGLRRLGYIWWLHILWLLCSLPVITAGAASTALIFSCMRLHDNDEKVTHNFLTSFKQNFIQSTILFCIFLIMGFVIAFDIMAGSSLDSAFGSILRLGALALILPYCVSLLYAFAIQAKFVNAIKDTLRYSMIIAKKYLKYTLQILCIAGIFVWINTTIVLANFFTLSMGVGVFVYFLSGRYNRIFNSILELHNTQMHNV